MLSATEADLLERAITSSLVGQDGMRVLALRSRLLFLAGHIDGVVQMLKSFQHTDQELCDFAEQSRCELGVLVCYHNYIDGYEFLTNPTWCSRASLARHLGLG